MHQLEFYKWDPFNPISQFHKEGLGSFLIKGT